MTFEGLEEDEEEEEEEDTSQQNADAVDQGNGIELGA